MLGLDIETAGDGEGYALQPWRVREGTARVTLVGIGSNEKVRQFKTVDVVNQLPPSTFVGWNVMFDAAFLYASGVDIKRHKWVDARLIAKWLYNSQENEARQGGYWGLGATAERVLTDWEHREVFSRLKAVEVEPGVNDKYWEARNKLDVVATIKLYEYFWSRLNTNQKRGALVEASNIVPSAISYVEGILTDPDIYEKAQEPTLAEMHAIEDKLGLRTSADEPSKILRSPKQLAELLYGTWGLECETYTDKGQQSSSKAALTYLSDNDDRVLDILAWRSHNTVYTKFLQSPANSRAYLGSDVFHPQPRIFSTYTGRYTYSSKILKKFPVGMALHQMPRDGAVRDMVKVPEGKVLFEFDASGQESRLLAEVGDIGTLKEIFINGTDYHSDTGAAITQTTYDDVHGRYKANDSDAKRVRYAGKFNNLSNQYRVSARKSRIVARVQYGIIESVEAIKHQQRAWHIRHPGVKAYWASSIEKAYRNGYAETLAGRRYYISEYGDEDKWRSESSAINFPIQGSGGDMKNLAIKYIYENYPELQFAWDLHDGIFYWGDKNKETMQLAVQVRKELDNLNYADEWGYEPHVPLTWDLAVGLKWSNMREV